MNIFEKYSEFITTDPRTSRPQLYQIDSEFMDHRHRCLFDKISLKDKTVLDLGSCVGSSGAWSLDNGARFYCGVEYSKDLADISTKNLSTYFEKDRFNIINSSVEDFFIKNTTKFDIILAGGLLHAYYEPIPFLNKLSEISDTIIIEEYHPFNNISKDEVPTFLKNSPLWKQFIETGSFIRYVRVPMLWGANRENIVYNGSLPSMGFVISHMNILGFDYDPELNQNLKQHIPNTYNILNRYGIRFFRNLEKQKLSTGFLSAVNSPDSKIIQWDKL